jgi:2',3'-cyclic-nucleotide 2'-phosphodiesterase / 3'-nucleotidase / 5'-nucleotidase
MPLLLALLVTLQNPPPAVVPPAVLPESAHVVIVSTTDVHGHVLGWDYVNDREAPGGLSRAATILQTLRAQYPDQVVVVDAGDLIEGTPFATYFAGEGRQRPWPVVDALNALQYDAATPGNHEFNFGLDALADAVAGATYRYVSANITRGAGDTLVFAPYTVVGRGGVKVGITGFTTPGVMVWDRANLSGRMRVRPIAPAAPAALRQLARAGVDLKVVLVHSGLGEPSSYDTAGVGPENAAAVLAGMDPKPDLVVFGHTHREVRDTVINGVHFVQPRNGALSVSVVHVWFARTAGVAGRPAGPWRVTGMRADMIPLATVAESPGFVRRFQAVHERVRVWAATPIGTAGPGFDARMGRAQDTPLLDFINEVQRRHAGAQLSATADFDLAAGLPAGEVRVRDVEGIYPYQNTLRALKISGQQLKDFLEQAARYYRTYQPGASVVDPAVPGYNFDVVSGVNYAIDLTQPAGRRIRGLTFQGRPVTGADSFTIALNSYRAVGGGGYDMLKGARVVYDRGEDVRTLLANEIRRAGALDARAWYTPSWSILPPARDAVARTFAPAPSPVSEADSTLLRVLAITDFHGALASRAWPWSGSREVGGAAALKPWLDSLARVCGCTSVRLDAGDEMQGTPISNFSYGRATIEALNTFGLDAAAIGNHEFDWSVDTLRARMRDARYPFVSANITDSVGRARPEWAEPWTLVQRGGVKIAVIGLTTASTPTTTAPRNVRGLAFGEGAAAVRRELPRARAAADFVIVLAHEGAICDSTTPCQGEILDVARGLDSGSVDLIVAGHTHRVLSTTVHGIPVVEAGSSGNAVAVVDFVRAGSRGRQVRVEIDTPYVDKVTADPELAALVVRYQHAVEDITSRAVVTMAAALHRQGGDYPLGRLIADAYRNVARADVGLVNNGGIRTDLAAGGVTYGDLYAVTPFQNRLVRVSVPGKVLRQALEHALAGGAPDAHVAGLEVWYDPHRPVGRRVKKVRMDNGRGLSDGTTYTLAVPDFIAEGGSGFDMLKSWPRADLGAVDLDALISYLKVLRQPVTAPAEPRFHAPGER